MDKKEKLKKRQKSVRAKVFGTAERPRLYVFRSLNHTYAQMINDDKGETILTESDILKEDKKGKEKSKVTKKEKTERAFAVGEKIAKKAKEKNINKVVFDRGGHLYHGRVKAVAEGARKGGLQF